MIPLGCLLLVPLSFCVHGTFHHNVIDTAFKKQSPPKQYLAASFRSRVGAEICTFLVTTAGSTC